MLMSERREREGSQLKWITAFVAMMALASATPVLSAAPQYDDHRLRVSIASKDQKRSFEFYGVLGMKPGFKHTETSVELNWPNDMAGIINKHGPRRATVKPTRPLLIALPDLIQTT